MLKEDDASSLRKKAVMGWLICTLAALFYCYEYLLRIVPSVMVPKLMQNFQVNASGVGYLSTAYLLGYAPMQLWVGALTDRFGSRLPVTVMT